MTIQQGEQRKNGCAHKSHEESEAQPQEGISTGGEDETIDEGEDPEGNDRKKKERPSWILFSL